MATKTEERDEERTSRKKGDAVTTDPNIISVAPTPEEQTAYLAEQKKVREEVGQYEEKIRKEDLEKAIAAGTLAPLVNPDSRLPHVLHERHGQIAPPNQNPTARCVVCGDPLAVGQNFVCRAHVRAG